MEYERVPGAGHDGYPQFPHEPGVRYTANGWAIKKQINYGDLIAFAMLTVMIGTPLIIWASNQSEKTTINSQQIEKQAQKNHQQDERINRMEARTDRSLRSVEVKLDDLNDNLIEYIRLNNNNGGNGLSGYGPND